jgi:hypothetical protein
MLSMAFKLKSVLTFSIVNSLLLLIINNLYDWQGNYFILGFIDVVIPNFISLAMATFTVIVIKELLNKPLWLTLLLIVVNELAFAVYERRIVFFHLFDYKTPENIIPVDSNYFIIISTSGVASAIITMIYSQKWKKQNT